MSTEARSRLIEAIARDESARAGPQRVASTRARALSAAADVAQKKAELEQAELNLGYTKILAPVTGEVTKKVVVGLNVDPGEQMLTVVPLDQVWITANFKETQLKHMRVGQKARLTSTRTAAHTTVMSTALREQRDPSSACCLRKTQPATT
jgi:membrane fusion protein, multidrug efflux system